MAIKNCFLRREVIELTGATLSQLRYLEQLRLVVPVREGSNKKPEVLYSWIQLLEVRAIYAIRKSTSLQTVRRILGYLKQVEGNPQLRDKHLVVLEDGEVLWVQHDWKDFGEQMNAVKVAGKGKAPVGQYTMIVIPALADLAEELVDKARSSSKIDFEGFARRAETAQSRYG